MTEIPSTAKEETKVTFNLWEVAQVKLTKEIGVCKPKLDGTLTSNQCQRMIDDLETELKRVKNRFGEFQDAMASESLKFEVHENKFWRERVECEKLIDDLTAKLKQVSVSASSVQSETSTRNSSNSNNDLKVSVPQFFGEVDKWDEFWTLFKELVHDKDNLSYGMKFIHLRNAIKGDAVDVIDGFKPNKEGYDDAIESLKENYDHSSLSEQRLRHMLYDLNPIRHNMDDLIKFRRSYKKIIRGLGHLVKINDQLSFVMDILVSKLAPETVDFLVNHYKSADFSYEQMDTALGILIQTLGGCLRFKSRFSQQRAVSCNGATVQSSKVIYCAFCAEAHTSLKCPTYVSSSDRKSRLMDLKACIRCGRVGHFARECRTRFTCFKCQGNHWAALCANQDDKSPNYGRATPSSGGAVGLISQASNPISNKGPSQNFNRKMHHSNHQNPTTASRPKSQSTSAVTQNAQTNISASSVSLERNSGGVALPTAQLKVLGKGNRSQVIRVFFDIGAQCSFVHPHLIAKLGLVATGNQLIQLKAFGNEVERVLCSTTILKVCNGKKLVRVKALITEKVESEIHASGLREAASKLTNQGIKLADSYDSDIVDDIQLIIGADLFGNFITGISKVDRFDLLRTHYGHMIYGKLSQECTNQDELISQSIVVARITVGNMESWSNEIEISSKPDVTELWNLEAIGIHDQQRELSSSEESLMVDFAKTIEYANGKYWVGLPWKDDPSYLPTNYRVARGQLNSLINKLKGEPVKYQHYDKIIREYESQEFIEMVENEPIQGHYLPHHCVQKQSTTTPIRIVFNASSKANQRAPCLNDMLETGPNLTNKLVDCLAQFRMKKYGVSADISKAFLRVGLIERDRDYVKFLWVNSLDEDKIVTYRFRSVMFGSTSSPFLLQATLYRHFMQSQSNYKDLLLNSFYVDNFMTTVDREEELFQLHTEVNKCLTEAGMPLQLWNSNSQVFNEFIQDDEREGVTNILGLLWDTSSDNICLKPVRLNQVESLSKRRALSLISSVYDPLGLLTPVTIRGKLLIRDIWKLKVDWDDDLVGEFVERMNCLIDEFNVLHTIKFPRCVLVSGEECELHVFCDASQEAYGACSYIVSHDSCSLFMSRTRVAPVKTRTIPQLELTAMLVGCRLVRYICENVFNTFKCVTVWSDNQGCLCWVNNDNAKEVYVRNRVHEIRRLCQSYDIQLQYVPTEDNPADMLSRGALVSEIINSKWMIDSGWLQALARSEDIPEIVVREITTQRLNISEVVPIFSVERYSSLRKLLAVTTNVFTFLDKCSKGMLKIPQASIYWIRTEQRIHYPLVYECLSTQGTGEQYKESLRFVKELYLYLDGEGLIRSKGRICNADCSEGMKYPILLSPRSFLCTLLIRKFHEEDHHCGTQQTLGNLRSEFWVPRGRQAVKKIVERCILCKYFNGKSFTYPGPPALPVERVSFSRPFQHTAVDFTGAIETREGQDSSKHYICLFTCLATRAVHLELIDTLSAEGFLNCFRRFIARCSLPDKMYSDNGKNFVAVSKFLSSLQEYPEVSEFLEQRKLKWYFNVPNSPWQGGVFERMIKVVKSCLHKALHFRKVSTRELCTLLAEVETIVNNRPITYLDADVTNEEALTPSHLLYGRKLRLYPNVVIDDVIFDPINHKEVLLNFHNAQSMIIRKFVRLWQTEYLQSLREKHYSEGNVKVRVPLVNEVVIVKIKDDRRLWQLGKVIEIAPGGDNKVREVKVLHDGVVSRMTVDKLIPLEINQEGPQNDINPSDISDPSDEPSVAQPDETLSVRPKRKAAEKADADRKQLIEEDRL